MPSTLALVKKEQPKTPEETPLQFSDRTEEDAYWKLREKKKRTKDEEDELEELKKKMSGKYSLNTHQFPAFFVEEDFKPPLERVHRELVAQYGSDTPIKKMLIQRICCAWGHAWSYERMFLALKYKKAEEGGYTFSFDRDRTRCLAEIRKGMESVDDEIIRLSQALQNIASPPIQVKAKNVRLQH